MHAAWYLYANYHKLDKNIFDAWGIIYKIAANWNKPKLFRIGQLFDR